MLPVPLAYKYVAVAAMLAEINFFCAARLHVSGNFPLNRRKLKRRSSFILN